jgi:rhomboid protease GluP
MYNRFNGSGYNNYGQRGGFNWNTFKSIPLTYIILFVNIVFYVITAGLQQTVGIDLNEMLGRFNYSVIKGEYWRLIMPLFLHGGPVHLAVNSYSLYIIGVQVEQLFGRSRFLIIYFAGGLFGNILGFAFSKMNVLSVGASGAIFALLGAMLYYALIMKKRGFSKSLLNNILFIIIFNLAYGFTQPGIDNLAHLGGLIGGFTMGSGLGEGGSRMNKQNRLLYIGGLAILGVILLIIGFSRSPGTLYS